MTISSASPLENQGNNTRNIDQMRQRSDESSLTDATDNLSLSPRSVISEKRKRVNKLSKYHKELVGLHRSTAFKPQRTQNRRNIPAFLNKLFNMVDDQSTANLIHWSIKGDSFLVENHEEFSQTVLPRFFKHNTFSSFVRQLNMYDFHKVPVVQQGSADPKKEVWEFKHPNFQKGRPELLSLVIRKRNRDKEQPSNEQVDLPTLIEDMSAVQERQMEIIKSLHTLHTENETIWKEAMELRDKYRRQQNLTSKVLQFLSIMFGGHETHLKQALFDLQDSIEVKERNMKENIPHSLMNEADLKNPESISQAATQNTERKNTTTDQKHMLYSNMFDSASKAAHNINQNMDQLWMNVETLTSHIYVDHLESNNASAKVTTESEFSAFVSNTSSDISNLRHDTNPCYMNLPHESRSGSMLQLTNTPVESSNGIFEDNIGKDEYKYKKNTQNKLLFINHRPSTVFYK